MRCLPRCESASDLDPRRNRCNASQSNDFQEKRGGTVGRRSNTSEINNPFLFQRFGAQLGRGLSWMPIHNVDDCIRSARVIEVLSRLVSTCGAPTFLRSDNGPEFVSKALLSWIVAQSIGTALIELGKPWQNGVTESFNGKFRAITHVTQPKASHSRIPLFTKARLLVCGQHGSTVANRVFKKNVQMKGLRKWTVALSICAVAQPKSQTNLNRSISKLTLETA
jgi:hypothetical protein